MILYRGEFLWIVDKMYLVNYIIGMEVKIYYDEKGKAPFEKWIDKQNKNVTLRVASRIQRIVDTNNLGDYKDLKNDLYELRFFFESGIRVYFSKIDDNTVILLLGGGNKKTQKKDIKKAREMIKKIKEQDNG